MQIAFFGGNFLGLEKHEITLLLFEACKFVKTGKVDGIRFSTRPDTIDTERLDMLKEFPVSTVELGVQSMDDKVLTMVNRGHTSFDTENAVHLLKKHNFEIGLQMMVGLPGDDEKTSLSTGRRIADLSPDFVRIYPAVVLKNSLLATWYEKGKYTPLSLESAVTIVKKLHLLFREKNIRVIRMGLQTSKDLEKGAAIVAGPYHPAFGHMVFSEIFLDRAVSIIESGLESGNLFSDAILIKVNPRSISKMQGLKNQNIKLMKNKFHIKSITILQDPSIAEDGLTISPIH